MPMVESPGDGQKHGTPARYAAARTELSFRPVCSFKFGAIFAQQIMQLGCAHLMLEFRLHENLPQHMIRSHQDIVVVEQDIVDPHDAQFPEFRIRRERRTAEERHVHRVVHVVIEIGARRYDPVHKAGIDERNNGRRSKPGRSHRARQAHADRDLRLQHFLREQPARFLQPAGVVCQERVVYQVRHRFLAGDRFRQNALPAQKLLFPFGKLVRIFADKSLGQFDITHACFSFYFFIFPFPSSV